MEQEVDTRMFYRLKPSNSGGLLPGVWGAEILLKVQQRSRETIRGTGGLTSLLNVDLICMQEAKSTLQ